jgi:hypothetical protein
MSQKWNLQDIRPAGQSRPKRRATRPTIDTRSESRREAQSDEPTSPPSISVTDNTLDSIKIEDGNKNSKSKFIVSIVIFVVIVGGAALLSGLLGKTEVTIYPEFRDPNVSAEFTAFPNPTNGSLSYEIMTLEATSESQVQATGKIDVEEQATGILEISKSTPGAERLIKNTRFRSPEGLVFRIQESVVVPGAVNDSPGTIQAEVFADEVGDAYNLPAGTTFDVPGFQEGGFTALFDAISASNPQAITGGFAGPQFQIDDGELNTARQALQIELRDELLARIDGERPAGTIAFKNAVAITYTQLASVEYGQDLVTIREQAILQIPVFKEDDFGRYIASETVPTYDGGPVRVEDPSALIFTYSAATTSNSVIANLASLEFKLTGKPRLIWEYDGEELAANLAGLPKTAINNAITAYPGIESARVSVTPFWKQTFPEDPTEIIIIEELREE